MACVTNINYSIEGQIEDEQYDMLNAELNLIAAKYHVELSNHNY